MNNFEKLLEMMYILLRKEKASISNFYARSSSSSSSIMVPSI